MPVSTSDGKIYEDELDYLFDRPMTIGGTEGTYNKETDTFQANQDQQQKKLYFVRHGDTDLNTESGEHSDEQPVRGWSQVNLNDTGRADAEKAAKSVSGLPLTHIVASDLPRAKETADIIGRRLNIKPEYDPGLRTWDVGDLTGKAGKDVHDQVDHYCEQAKDERPPGSSESFNEFRGRILSTVHNIVSNHSPDHEILMVSHNSPERVLDEHLNGADYKDKGIEPGEHKIFEYKNLGDAEAAQWLSQNPEHTFEERWPYLGKGFPSPIDVPHGKDQVMNWFKYLPKQTQQEVQSAQYEHKLRLQKILNASRGLTAPVESDTGELWRPLLPYADFMPIADIENSVESLAQKHGVEGSKMRDIITDVLKHPTDYISPMPGLGMARGPTKVPPNLTYKYKYGDLIKRPTEVPDESLVEKGPTGKSEVQIQKRLERQERLKDLSDWMKNQFEGAPVEAEPKYSLEKAEKPDIVDWPRGPRGWTIAGGGGVAFGPGEDKFIVRNSEGKEIATVLSTYMADQKRLAISIGGNVKNANTVGTVDMTAMAKELVKHYPEAKFMSGFRTTGARAARGGKQTLVKIPESWRE